MNDKISDKDKQDWDNFLSSKDKLFNKDQKSDQKINLKTINIDLHGFSLEKANEIIERSINNSFNKGVSKIIVVTGKGLHSDIDKDPYVSKNLSILKHSVPDFIKNNVELMKKIISLKDANNKDGGSGAFYIFLKKKL
ncbi:Smr/MutS family protein [Candidatus Pelagibacter sp.]|nr:Smr/MutS family protein [Candidatus Pelagibacter sp.]